jgi:anti-sigma factor RsiW
MKTPFTCEEKDRLVAFLYDEADADERADVETHLSSCPACATELASFTALRRDLRRWEPPEADLGFRMVREDEPRRSWWSPARLLPVAAAAVLILGATAALTNLEVRYENGGVTVRTGWTQPAPTVTAGPPAATEGTPPAGPSEEDVAAALSSLEARLRAELGEPRPSPATAPQVDRGDLLQQVRSLIEESERRQQRELALRLAQVVRDFDAQRQADLVRIENGFGQIEGLTEEEAARQRALLDYLVRASQRR